MDLEAVRSELAALAPSGWTAYDYTPGAAVAPALVVGMPESITFDGSYNMAQVTIPVYVVEAPQFDKDAETRLMSGALTVSDSYRSVTGTSFASCRVSGINSFIPQTIGTTEAVTATVYLELLIRL